MIEVTTATPWTVLLRFSPGFSVREEPREGQGVPFDSSLIWYTWAQRFGQWETASQDPDKKS